MPLHELARVGVLALAVCLLGAGLPLGPADADYAEPDRRAQATSTPASVTAYPVGPGYGGEPWPQYRGGPGKRGFATWRDPELPGAQILWQHRFLDQVLQMGPQLLDASPTVGKDGTIYLGLVKQGPAQDRGGGGLAVFKPDGSPGPFGIGFLLDGIRAAPAIRDDGSVVFVTYRYVPVYEDPFMEGDFIRWDRAGRISFHGPGGDQLHTRDLLEGAIGLGSPALDREDNIYHWDEYVLRMFSPTHAMNEVAHTGISLSGGGFWSPTGTIVDHQDPNTLPLEGLTPSLAYSEQCVDLVATSPEGTLRVRASTEGHWTENVLWSKDIPGATTPAIGDGGRVYILTTDKHLEARDQDGTRVFRVPLYGYPTAPPALGHGVRDSGDTSRVQCGLNERDHRSWESADDIYVPVSDGYLYAYDYKGRERWNRHVGNELVGAPVVIGLEDGREMVIVGSDWAGLHAFDRDGTPLWFLELDKPALGSPAVAHGRIYVATNYSLYAIGALDRLQLPDQPFGLDKPDDSRKPDPGPVGVAPTPTMTPTPSSTPTATPTRSSRNPGIRLTPQTLVPGPD